MMETVGRIYRVNGPVVEIAEVQSLQMLDMVEVGSLRLVGEVVHLRSDRALVQVYEDTTGLRPGDPVYSRHQPLSVELGPGLLGSIYDGIQRPLKMIQENQGFAIGRGSHLPPLDRTKLWKFSPQVVSGQEVSSGEVIGEVQETGLVKHLVMVPPSVSGKVCQIVPSGEYSVDQEVAVIESDQGKYLLTMSQHWPVRRARPYRRKIESAEPLLTGQRVVDTLFPLVKGGCVAVPGGFGTGKTVVQHQLAKWSNADIVVFVGCGERGNEMADVLLSFPELIDPRRQRPLMERTILVANTSNMPVSAREASIYTGITLAEYYRDMGYQVALMVDSTSRWAEALRELSGRLEEMPMEEGFPAYLPSRLAEFYERSGAVETLSRRTGSVSVIASVSPPGGDFSEPVTAHTRRFVRAFWALDRELANQRHYPAISWVESYSEYLEEVKEWWDRNVSSEWLALRYGVMDLLQKEERLSQVVKVVGPDVLPPSQRLILQICGLFKNAFLQQNAFDPVDAYSSARKQFLMLKAIIRFYQKAQVAVKSGMAVSRIRQSPVYQKLLRMKTDYPEDKLSQLENLIGQIDDAFQLEEF
ncbi:MAG: V-type ATP synthase subunit A [Candidatus Omnitrophica bacterium]|nr:V-type ATP synthase subunit A [Candidatus Omnitrophota bacterium]